ncbi:MAG: hypothetical protein ABSF22_26850 [Bryobacteraceae bacterium]
MTKLIPVHRSVLQAQPGWTVVVPEERENSTSGLYRIPVILWRNDVYKITAREQVDAYTGLADFFDVVVPITPMGSIEDQDYALQFGDHPPFFTTSENFDDEAALLAFFCKNQKLTAAIKKCRS